MLGGSACVDPRGQRVELEPGVRALAATLAPRSIEGASTSLRVVAARWLDDDPVVLALDDEALGVIVRIPVDALRDQDGRRLDDAGFTALTPTPGSALPLDVPLSCPWVGIDETVMAPGARCTLPTRARVSRVGVDGEAPDAQLDAVVRADLWLVDGRAPERCGLDEAVRSETRAGRIPLEVVAASGDGDDDFPLGAWAANSDGTTMLADPGRVTVIEPDGRRFEHAMPSARIMAEAALGRVGDGPARFLLAAVAEAGIVASPRLFLVSSATVSRISLDDNVRRRVRRIVPVDARRWVWVGTSILQVAGGFRAMLELCVLDGSVAQCNSLLGDAIPKVEVLDFGPLDDGRWMAVTNTGLTLTYARLPARTLARRPRLDPPRSPRAVDGEALDGDDGGAIRWSWRSTASDLSAGARVVGDGAVDCRDFGVSSGARVLHLGAEMTTTTTLACRLAATCDGIHDDARGTLRVRLQGVGSEAFALPRAGPRAPDEACRALEPTATPAGPLGFGLEVETRVRTGDTWAVATRDGGLHVATTTASAPRALRRVRGPKQPRAPGRWGYPVVLPLDEARAVAVSRNGVVDWLDGPARTSGEVEHAAGVFAGVIDHAATDADAVVAWLVTDVERLRALDVPALLRLRVPRGDPAAAAIEVVARTDDMPDGARAIAELRPGRFLIVLRNGLFASLDGASRRLELISAPNLGDRRASLGPPPRLEEGARSCSTRAPLAPSRVGIQDLADEDTPSPDVWTGADAAQGVGWVTGCDGRIARVVDVPGGAVRVEGISLRRPRSDGDAGFVQSVSRGDAANSQLRGLSPPAVLCGDSMFTVTELVGSAVFRFAEALVEARPLVRAEAEALREANAGYLVGDPGFFLHAEPSPSAALTDEGDPGWVVGDRGRLSVVMWSLGVGSQIRPQWPRPVGPDGRVPETAPAFRRLVVGAAGKGRTLWVSFSGGSIVRSALP